MLWQVGQMMDSWCFKSGAYFLLLALADSQIVHRSNGFSPDRILLQKPSCTEAVCANMNAVLAPRSNNCECICIEKKPTFSLSENTCVSFIPDCQDLAFEGATTPSEIFSFQLKDDRSMLPYLPVVPNNSSLMVQSCSTMAGLHYENSNGFQMLDNSSLIIVELFSSYRIQFTDQIKLNVLEGQLFKAVLHCDSQPLCLPFKISGNILISSPHQVTTEPSRQAQLTQTDVYIIAGAAVGIVLFVFAVMLMMAECKVCNKSRHTGMELTIERIQSKPNTLERRKTHDGHHSVNRSASWNERSTSMQPSYKVSASRQKSRAKRSRSFSNFSGDSGRGSERSLNPEISFTSGIATDAVGDFETRNFPHRSKDMPPQLFKSHQERLSTVQHGIQGVESQIKPTKPGSTRKRLANGLRKIFKMRASKLSSNHGDSHLTIDYDQFAIEEAPKPKLFTNAHINPDISFNAEGKVLSTDRSGETDLSSSRTFQGPEQLNQMPEIEIEMIPNPDYEPRSSEESAEDRRDWNRLDLPTTNIDDVELSSHDDNYEFVRSP